MWFSTFIFKNVSRRLMRSILTAVAMALGVAAVVSLVGISSEFRDSFGKMYREANFDLVVYNAGRFGGLAQAMPESLADRILKIDGVKEVVPGLTEIEYLEEGGQFPIQSYHPGAAVFDHYQLVDGRLLEPSDEHCVILGSQLARNMDVKVGDTFHALGQDWKVVGIFDTVNFIEKNAAVVPLKELQQLSLLSKPDDPAVTGLFVITTEHDNREFNRRVQEDIRKLIAEVKTERDDLANLKCNLTADHVESLQEVKLAHSMAWLTSTVALIIGAVGMVNTMLMSVQERTKEIGILRAIGWRKSRVMQMIVGEAVVLSAIGAVLGTAGGVILNKVLTSLPIIRNQMQGEIEPMVLAQAALIALLIGAFAGMLPAYRAARLAPTTALRYE
jgi:putative ABC transport system permease protein